MQPQLVTPATHERILVPSVGRRVGRRGVSITCRRRRRRSRENSIDQVTSAPNTSYSVFAVYIPLLHHLTKREEDFDEHRWNDAMAWPSSSEGGPSQFSRADAAFLAAEEEVSTGVLPQVLAVCTCLQIALMLLVMHRHSCVPPDSPKRNAASKLQAGAARQVARLSVVGRTLLAGPRARAPRWAALRIARGAAAMTRLSLAARSRNARRAEMAGSHED